MLQGVICPYISTSFFKPAKTSTDPPYQTTISEQNRTKDLLTQINYMVHELTEYTNENYEHKLILKPDNILATILDMHTT